MMGWAVFIPLLLGLLVVSFVLSGMEAGVLALNRLRIRNLMRKGGRRARLLHGWLEQPENFLWTILVGNTLANFLAGGLVVYALHRLLKDAPGWFAFWVLVMALLFYAWCELLPKTLFTRFPNRLTPLVAPLFRHPLPAPTAGGRDHDVEQRPAALDRRARLHRALVCESR
jgi:Mg2+/Co2+ transporter CorB